MESQRGTSGAYVIAWCCIMIEDSIALRRHVSISVCALGKNSVSKEGRNSMRDILPDVERWRERGERVAVATVVTMYGSAPRRPGAKLNAGIWHQRRRKFRENWAILRWHNSCVC